MGHRMKFLKILEEPRTKNTNMVVGESITEKHTEVDNQVDKNGPDFQCTGTSASVLGGDDESQMQSRRMKVFTRWQRIYREGNCPGILVKGSIHVKDSLQVAIVAEKQVICEVDGGMAEATVGFMAVNDVFMFYAASLNNFCFFLQKCVLQIQDGKKLPASVISLVNKLNVVAADL